MLTIVLDQVALQQARHRLASGDLVLAPAYAQLCHEAEKALASGPFSVLQKPFLPPSGDPHDYMSLSTYYWPDPTQPNGLPYINRDGEVNPERDTDDSKRLISMSRAVETLALAFFFSADQRYATHATNLLNTWFLDPATSMNPHLNYAQAIRGRNNGRAGGIIDMEFLSGVLDAIGLLHSADVWPSTLDNAFRVWCQQYLNWLQTSAFGQEERTKQNNHGSWYDLQVVALALFLEQTERAIEVLREVPTRRYAMQILEDGRQPYELARTRSMNYTTRNLTGLANLALLGERVGVDLWYATAPTGQGLRLALDWVCTHALGDIPWPNQQIVTFDYSGRLLPLLRLAARRYDADHYEALINRLPDQKQATSRMHLLYPASA
jgi:hypothetical protein